MTSWGTFQVTHLSPEQAKDPTSLQKFQPIYEKAKAYRGEIIEAAHFIESRLDKALDEAQAKGRTVVDMKQDWKVIYPFENK